MTYWLINKKTKDSITIIGMGIALGLCYPVLDSEGIVEIINGGLIGLLGGIMIAVLEVIINQGIFKKMSFKWLILIKTLIYSMFFTIMVPLVVSVSRSIYLQISWFEFIQQGRLKLFVLNEDFHIIMLYSLFGTLIFVFTYQMSRKLGQGVLKNYIIGKYHNPVEEERIFMILDIDHSTTIAEELGDVKFSNLLREFFMDITDSIVSCYGFIYRYVGDEVVISWDPKKELKRKSFVQTHFKVKKALDRNRQKFIQNYGLFPTFTSAYHIGMVIVAEIGELKSQISYFGETLHETSEIEKACKDYQSELLVSDALMDRLELSNKYVSKKVGTFQTSFLNDYDLYSIDLRKSLD